MNPYKRSDENALIRARYVCVFFSVRINPIGLFKKGNVLTTPTFLIDKASKRGGATTMRMHLSTVFVRSIVPRPQ